MTTSAVATDVVTDDREYDAFLQRVQARLNTTVGAPLFTTDASDLYTLFLGALPLEWRQYHTCHACRRFVESFGSLVTIDAHGVTQSALWHLDDTPEFYQAPVKAMLHAIRRARVTGVFLSSDTVWGTPVTGPWHHLAATSPSVFRRSTLTAGQVRAEKREDYGTLCRALADFTPEMLTSAVNLLKTESLYRSERVLGVAEWLLNLQSNRAAVNGTQRDNVTWLAVATAPAGFCHPRSSMIGTLLEDIAEGLPFADVSRRFASKMQSSQYQRAQVAPSSGAIQQAEKLFAELGLAPALARRYATRDELPSNALLWTPTQTKEQPQKDSGSIFGHLHPKDTAPAVAHATPATTMTWDKFQRTVLPTARTIEVLVPSTADRFMALVTAVNEDAPPILQWDSTEHRNAFSWYYAAGIDAEMRRRLVQAGGRVEGIDVRCSLMWNNRNDLDLHAVTPNGQHIFYGDKRACRFGGWLDVDMNVGGETDQPVENIRWEQGRAPDGHYQFFVNLYRTHHGYGSRTPFTVEIEADNQVFTVVGETRESNPYNHIAAMVRVANVVYERGKPVQVNADAAVRSVTASPNAWGVTPGSYAPVSAVVKSPNLWGEHPQAQHGQHAFFLLEDCHDTQSGVGRGFFTEMVRGDLRPVRSVLEAYTATAAIDGASDASACGVGISNTSTGNLTVRVTSPTGRAVYTLDRWD